MKKISRRSFLTVVGAAAATAALTACGGSSSSTAASTSSAASTAAPAATASNASVVLKFDLTVSLEHPWGLAATEFKNRIEEKSGGSMTVEIYPSSTSGSEADSLAGMLVGTTSMTMSGGSFNGYAPSATLLEAPWAYNSEEDVQAMCESDIGKGIMQDFEDAGFKVLWYQLRGPRELTSNVPINKASDLQGRKMRMSGNVLHNSMWTAAGAITSAIALSETFNALSQGVVEMQENPYDMIYDNSFYEVQKYVNQTNHVYSTIFNLLTKVYQPTRGTILLNGKDTHGMSTAQVNRAGIARTFQNIRLFPQQSVLDNVMTGLNNQVQYSLAESLLHVGSYHKKEKEMIERSMEILRVFGLEDSAQTLASNLPYGKQRKLEIARALATKPELLLLDEPAAGMNPNETGELMDTIRLVRKEYQVTILLIEHDMKLVQGICEYLYVLNFGRLLAEGTPDKVLNDPAVVKAYLGD